MRKNRYLFASSIRQVNPLRICIQAIFLAIVVLFATNAIAEEFACNNLAVKELVRKVIVFDCENLDNCIRYMDRLHHDAYDAAGCLINELHRVELTEFPDNVGFKENEKKQADASRVVNAIRTLRYITGLDFIAKTEYDLSKTGENRRYFLKLKHKDEVPFFAEWMSRGIVYLAPPDAQRKIIQKWKDWYVREGKNYKYEKNTDMVFWFF